jgi:hypothetical protein
VTDPPVATEADDEDPEPEPETSEEPAAEDPDDEPEDPEEEPAEEPEPADGDADGDADDDADDADEEPEPNAAASDADAGDVGSEGEADVAPPAEEEAPEGDPATPAREAQLLAENGRLLDENARLRAALKRNLAERVVDTKISLGLCEADGRDDEIASHISRSASSLADTLRDLASMPATRHPLDGLPKVQSTQAALEGDPEREIPAEVVETAPSPKPQEDPAENLLVDVFMGRRSL